MTLEYLLTTNDKEINFQVGITQFVCVKNLINNIPNFFIRPQDVFQVSQNDCMTVIHDLEKLFALNSILITIQLPTRLSLTLLNTFSQHYVVIAKGEYATLFKWSSDNYTTFNKVKMTNLKLRKVISGTSSTIVEDGILIK